MNKREQAEIYMIITARFQCKTKLLISSMQINLIT